MKKIMYYAIYHIYLHGPCCIKAYISLKYILFHLSIDLFEWKIEYDMPTICQDPLEWYLFFLLTLLGTYI